MGETERVLKPANENPWYVLMTLYGEQEGAEIDEALHEKNRAAWNAWSCQGMTEDERAIAAKAVGVDIAELSAWPTMSAEIKDKFRSRSQVHRTTRIELDAPTQIKGIVDLSKVNFDHFFAIKAMIFSRPVLLNGSVFSKNVDGEKAAFFFGIGANNALFQGDLWMVDATFKAQANFNKTVFKESICLSGATFRGGASFVEADIRGEAWFSRVEFCSTFRMTSATLNGLAYFGDAIFRSKTDFNMSSFFDETHFHKVRVDQSVSFNDVDFRETVSFAEAIFDSGDMRSDLNFIDCVFYRATSFRDAIFKTGYPRFSGTVLHEKTTFTAKPEFWPQSPQPDPEQAKASCAAIRHNLGKQGLPEEEHFFFRREMGFAAQIGGWWQRLPYRLFGALSDFGYSIQRPALWLFGLWLTVAMINHVVLQWGASLHGAEYHVAQAFGLSFANQFPVFGLHARWFTPAYLVALNPWLKALGGVQTVLSVPLLFFFALGLRTRFRMR